MRKHKQTPKEIELEPKWLGSSRSRTSATTAATAVDTIVAKSVGDARHPVTAKDSATTAATDFDTTVDVGEARPRETTKCSATQDTDVPLPQEVIVEVTQLIPAKRTPNRRRRAGVAPWWE